MGPPGLATATLAIGPLLGLVLGLAVGALLGPLLRRLPEPAPPAGDHRDAAAARAEIAAKRPYADLDRPGFRIACGALTAVVTTLVVVGVPPGAWPAWLVLATVGVPLAAVDAVTTWIPARWTHIGWVLVLVTSPLGLIAGATSSDLARTVLGGLVAGAAFWLCWGLSGGQVAFGDVRLAPLLGAAGAALSWPGLWWVLLGGTLGGALHGSVRALVLRRTGPFPYAPGLVGGAVVALAVRGILVS